MPRYRQTVLYNEMWNEIVRSYSAFDKWIVGICMNILLIQIFALVIESWDVVSFSFFMRPPKPESGSRYTMLRSWLDTMASRSDAKLSFSTLRIAWRQASCWLPLIRVKPRVWDHKSQSLDNVFKRQKLDLGPNRQHVLWKDAMPFALWIISSRGCGSMPQCFPVSTCVAVTLDEFFSWDYVYNLTLL